LGCAGLVVQLKVSDREGKVTGQLADCHLADWMTRGLVNSQIRQLADWTTCGCHQRLCILSFRFLAIINVFVRVYLNIYYAGDLVSYGRPTE